MDNGFPHNFVQIILHPIKGSEIRLEVKPDTANCKAGIEELIFVVDWSKAEGAWDGVRIGNFTVGNAKVQTNGDDEVIIAKDSNIVGKIDFAEYVTPKTKKTCKYDICFYRASPAETIVLDPTVVLRPGDWVPETDG